MINSKPPASSDLFIWSDGGSRGNPGPSATGYVIKDTGGHVLKTGHRYLGQATNNIAEYTAVLDALLAIDQLQLSPSPSTLNFYLDSLLIVKQLQGDYKIKNQVLFSLASQIFRHLSSRHFKATFSHIPREKNQAADALVNQALDAALA